MTLAIELIATVIFTIITATVTVDDTTPQTVGADRPNLSSEPCPTPTSRCRGPPP